MLPSSSSPTPSGREAPFRVSTREISLDFSSIGPSEPPQEIGSLSEPAFRTLIEKFAAVPSLKLVDGDPTLVVTAKRGRFFVLPANGKLLVRSAADTQRPYERFDPSELPRYLDTSDQAIPTAPQAKKISSLIGAASVAAEKAPSTPPPAAPIFGSFPDLAARVATPPAQPAAAAIAPNFKKTPPRRRSLVGVGATLLALTAAATLWVFFAPAANNPPRPVHASAQLDFVDAPDKRAELTRRFAGTYATTADSGERLLELRADGTFHYQEFGANLARTINRTDAYVFAYRHGTTTLLIRANGLGLIEVRDDKNLAYKKAVFTRLPN
jgi:hypothetical protein